MYEIDSPGPREVVGWSTPSIVAVRSTPAVALTVTPTPGPGVGDTNGVVAVGIVAGGGAPPRDTIPTATAAISTIAAAIRRNRWLSRIRAAASACSTRPVFAGGDGSSGSSACLA